jgi:hypothetical protein
LVACAGKGRTVATQDGRRVACSLWEEPFAAECYLFNAGNYLVFFILLNKIKSKREYIEMKIRNVKV